MTMMELYRSARQYVELGLPIVLLMKNHHPPQGLQQKIELILATILRILNYYNKISNNTTLNT